MTPEDFIISVYCAIDDFLHKLFGSRRLRLSGIGVITGISVTAANVDEREALWDFAASAPGLWIGDKGYLSASLRQELLESCGVRLETPLRSNMLDSRPVSTFRLLVATRRLVETVIGQLTEQFHIEKVRARDLWHLTDRFSRKIFAHTIGICLNCQLGRSPLQFEGLLQP
ncbi:MAG: transposase [Magnetococcales bacterium]|nr:transposase [Magnetococcales bacterium]